MLLLDGVFVALQVVVGGALLALYHPALIVLAAVPQWRSSPGSRRSHAILRRSTIVAAHDLRARSRRLRSSASDRQKPICGPRRNDSFGPLTVANPFETL